MASGDGWLVRLRTSARALKSHELRAVARLAHAYGNGVIELTRRANLQLRGLQIERIPQLRAELIALGLVAASPVREGRPALLVDPLAASVLAELAQALDEALSESAAAGALSAKLGIVLDAGSGSVSGIDADIRIVAQGSAEHVQVFVGTQSGSELLGECLRAHAPAAIKALLAAAATPCDRRTTTTPVAPRMRDLVAARGLEALRACAALTLAAIPASAPPPRAALGFHSVVGCSWFGVGVAFGSASHETWLALAELAERFGNAELRLTPAREVLLTGVQSAQADELARDAHALGLITEKSDPRRRIVACSGAPACSSAYGDTRALASAIQPLLAAGATLHISGCGKGCASRASSDVSVVLAANGARLALNADIAAASCAPVEPLTTISAKLAALPGRSDTHDKVQR